MTEEVVEERLKNDEFRELIPYLQLEDLFLIQIKHPEWQRMFECVTKNEDEHLRCNLCVDKPLLKFKNFEGHIKEESHKDALKCVDEFYHPVYTYAKDKESSVQQECASASNINETTDAAQTFEAKRLASLVNNLSKQKVIQLSMDEILNIICFNDKRFPLVSHGRKDLLRCVLCNKIIKDLDKHFREESHVNKMLALKNISLENHPEVNKYSIIQTDMNTKDVLEYERILREIVLKEKPKAPHMIQIVCEMVISDLLLLEYTNKNQIKYKPMLKKVDGQPSLVRCFLCGKTCTIGSVHSHLLGKQHKKMQIELKDLRHKTNNQVTKYWSFSLGQEYNFQVTLKARKKHKARVISELNRLKKLNSKDAKRDLSEDNEMASSEACQNENEESRNEEQTGESHEEIVDLVDEADPVETPQLSAKVAAKVRALQAANSNKNKADFQNLDNDKKPKEPLRNPIPDVKPEDALIGVEYVVKVLQHPNAKSQLYECCLCEVLMNERHMQAHLTGYNHRYKYCELHYSDALKKYLGYLSNRECKDVALVMGAILEKVAYEIEKYHGRCVPRGVPADEFKNKRPEVIAKLYCSKHATQQFGPSYTNIVSQEEVDTLIENKDTIRKERKIPKNSTNRFIILTKGLVYCKQKIRADNLVNYDAEGRPNRDRSFEIRRRSRSHSPNRIKRSSAPKLPERSFRLAKERISSEFNHKQSIWQKYRQQILISASEVEYAYIEYRKNPESHPLYDQEWNRFWKQRKDELTAQNIDHRSYNFQPDWVPYFRNRIEQLFGEALQQAKLDVRRRLNIPMDAEEDCESGIKVNDNEIPRNFILRNEAQRDRPSNIIPIMQEKQTSLVRFIPPEPVHKKQRFDAESLVNQWNAQNISRRSDEFRQDERERSSRVHNYADRKPDVIHVLRLMAAFEDYLGSLGPKITDVLFTTLSLDKTLPKDTLLLEQKVLTASNCSLLETAMEKLKGILYAGLLDNSKEPGFNQVIQCTENLLNYADKMDYRQQFSVIQENAESSYSKNIQPTSDTNFQELFNFINNQNKVDRNSTEGEMFLPDLRSNANPSNGNRYNSQYNNTNLNFNPKQQNFTNTMQLYNQEQRQERNLANRNNSNANQNNPAFNRETQNRFNNNTGNERFSSGNSAIPEMGGRNNRLQGSSHSSDNINMASVVGRNNHDKSNLNNNYPRNNYPNANANSNAMFQSGGFSGNWNRNSGNNEHQPNPAKRDWKQTNSMGGNMSALQLQNLKQLQFLRQQQQQRLNRQK